MKDILEQAEKYRQEIERIAIAHEVSAEWHRSRGVLLGVTATVLSAVVSTSIFATYITKLEEGKLDLTFLHSNDGFSWVIFVLFISIVILSPVFTGIQTYLKHPEQAETHKLSYIGYSSLQRRLELFLLRYSDDKSGNDDREKALKALEDISTDIKKVADSSITLTESAYADADRKLSKLHQKTKPWYKFCCRDNIDKRDLEANNKP